MKNEQILVFFSTLYADGLVLDYSRGGEVEVDVEEGGCFDVGDLRIEAPRSDGGAWYGLWMWEGEVRVGGISEGLEYVGSWRRLMAEEIVDLVKGCRVVEDKVSADGDDEAGRELLSAFMKSGLVN